MSETENKKNATERLEDLEKAIGQVIQMLQPMEIMAKDLMGLKDALKLMNNKVDSVVKSFNEGGEITDERLSAFMVENNVKELADKVANMVGSGLLVASDTVQSESFVVINEVDPSGKVVNPRMQFLLSALQHEEVRTKLTGAKVGTNLTIGDQGASINVLEAYNIITPQADSEAKGPEAAPVEATVESTAEAPATETATA
jgi:hypothetical protein